MKAFLYYSWLRLSLTRQWMKHSIMFLCLFFMVSPAFAGGDASEGNLILLMLLMLAILIAPPLFLALIAPMLVSRTRQSEKKASNETEKKFSASDLRAKVFVITLLFWGISLYAYNQFHTWRSARESSQHAEQLQRTTEADDLIWKNTPLRIAACRGDLPSLKNLVNVEQKNSELDLKIKVAKECAVGRERADVLEILLDDPIYHVQENLSAGLAISEAVFDSMDVQLLQVLLQKKIPLSQERQFEFCLASLLKNDTKTPEQKIAWLSILSENGVNLNHVSTLGASLLRVAFETQSAPVIQFALDRGIDPYAATVKTVNIIIEKRADSSGTTTLEKTERFSWSPVQSWTLRRFGYTWSEHREKNMKIPLLSEKEIAIIHRRLRDLTPDESRLGFKSFQLRTDTPDGGASLFAYMLERGVQLDTADASGKGFLSPYMPYSDQLIAVLAKLEDSQLQQLVCPSAQPGSRAKYLVDEAKKSRNQVLITFLESRQLTRCTVQP